MVRVAHSLFVLASLVATCLSQGYPPPPPAAGGGGVLPPLIAPCGIPLLPEISNLRACDMNCLVTSATSVNKAFTSLRTQIKAMRQAAYYQAGPAATGPSIDISALTNSLAVMQTEAEGVSAEITGLMTAITTQASPQAPGAPDAAPNAAPDAPPA